MNELRLKICACYSQQARSVTMQWLTQLCDKKWWCTNIYSLPRSTVKTSNNYHRKLDDKNLKYQNTEKAFNLMSIARNNHVQLCKHNKQHQFANYKPNTESHCKLSFTIRHNERQVMCQTSLFLRQVELSDKDEKAHFFFTQNWQKCQFVYTWNSWEKLIKKNKIKNLINK